MKIKGLLIKLTSLALAAVCSLSFISCSKDIFSGVESTEDELRVVGKVGDYEVCYDELYYLIMSCKDIMKGKYGSDIWKTEASAAEYADELCDMVMERITANYAVFIFSEENGIKTPLKNKEIVEAVNDKINYTLYEIASNNGIEVTMDEKLNGDIVYNYEAGGVALAEKIFKEALDETYLTERAMRISIAAETAFSMLVNSLSGKGEIIYSDADIEKFMLSDEFICTKHVFVSGLSEESLNRASAALTELHAGTPMDNLIAGKYNDDVTATPDGYYFTRGEMESAYEEAAFSLNEGEFSGIVATDIGYFIIERCEKSTSHMLANISTYSKQIIYAQVNDLVSERQAKLSLELSDFGKSLEFYKIAVSEENKGDIK